VIPDLRNRRPRRTLGEEIDRLDGILDGLAEGLNAAIADAVQVSVTKAVSEALAPMPVQAATNGAPSVGDAFSKTCCSIERQPGAGVTPMLQTDARPCATAPAAALAQWLLGTTGWLGLVLCATLLIGRLAGAVHLAWPHLAAAIVAILCFALSLMLLAALPWTSEPERPKPPAP